jgi:acetylornithine deacetylase/succinyl-diaminopimelate desuccinylase-like protein
MDDVIRLIDEHLDERYLVDTLRRLATVPTDVPLGFDTLMEPDDPKLVHYVQDHVRAELVSLGHYDVVEAPRNNLIARYGPDGTDGPLLLIQNYTVAQHHNLMSDPWSGKVGSARDFGVDRPSVFGQGVSQNKAHQAVMLALFKMFREADVELEGQLLWAVNNEGRSTHDCSEAVLSTLDRMPDFCILQTGTDMRVSVGNRGRIDIDVHVRGRATHSSTPQLGDCAIVGAQRVMNRLENITWGDTHPILGARHAVVYKIEFWPVAPHTLPSDAHITVDYRLLPGDDPADAVRRVEEALADLDPYTIEVSESVTMLPNLVDPQHPWVRKLQEANVQVKGGPAEEYYLQGTFDAGGPGSHGIPTVMFGASAGVWPVGEDFVPIDDVIAEARILGALILGNLR